MKKEVDRCVELHNPNDWEKKTYNALLSEVEFEVEEGCVGIIDMPFIQLAEEARVSHGELIKALIFWQGAALITMDVGRNETDSIVIFLNPLAFVVATKMSNVYKESSDWKRGFILTDLDSGTIYYRP